MATLVLTAVGTALGGPIGGLIGAAVGQAVDSRWLTPAGRRGPRLSDLRVQTSSYGTPIPRLYGRMRVAGTVIWATDLIEHRQRRSNGKGQPKSTTYSYSASFAVALSSRPVVAVHRIWADGNILRGADGAFVEQADFRLHIGGDDQPVDPLIASAEGLDMAPAFRGLAYAVFEGLDLSAFGNRIPSLTFEVEADGGPMDLASPVVDVLEDVSLLSAPPITGYALTGLSRREALEPLAAALHVYRKAGGGWRVPDADDIAMALPDAAGLPGTTVPERRTGAVDRLPREVGVAHFDPGRDFQTGVQAATLSGGGGSVMAIDLPMAADAGAARQIAEREAADLRAGQRSVTWPGGLAALAIPPGSPVLDGAFRLRVSERRIEGGAVVLQGRGVAAVDPPSMLANGGRATISPDQPAGQTIAALFDLPALVPADVDQVRLVLAAGGTGAGWRRAAVGLSASAGAADTGIGTIYAAAAIGSVAAIGGHGSEHLFDDASWIEVILAQSAMTLSNADDRDLLSGANVAVVGNEIVQFGHAAPLGGGRWRLTRLLRGRRGSAVSAAIGDAFALLDDVSLLPVGDAGLVPQVGGVVTVAATGAAAALQLPIIQAGRAQRPLCPVHLRHEWTGGGDLLLHWIRRSRTGFDWRDGVDAPLDVLTDSYRVTLDVAATAINVEVAVPTCTVAAADIADWRAAGATTLAVAVTQVGGLGLSAPATRSIALNP